MSVTAPAAPAAAPGRAGVDPAQVLALARHVLATEANAIVGARRAARRRLRRRRRSDPPLPGPRGRVRHRQVRPHRAQARGDAGLDGHAGILRPPGGSLARRPRHDHAGGCRGDAVEFRRDRRARAADAAPQATGREDRRADRQRAVVARAGGRRASRRGGRRRSLPAGSRADGQHDRHAGAGRRARARAARRARLLGRGLRPLASRRPARAPPAHPRARRDGERRRAAHRRHRRDARRGRRRR